eukprot:7213065-Prymnesium_polylepis.1
MLLFHHRPSKITLHLELEARRTVSFTEGSEDGTLWYASVSHGSARRECDTERVYRESCAPFSARAKLHSRAAAGSPLELFVRKAACGDTAGLPWTVRGDGTLVNEMSGEASEAVGALMADGFRMTPGGCLLHEFRQRPSRPSMFAIAARPEEGGAPLRPKFCITFPAALHGRSSAE